MTNNLPPPETSVPFCCGICSKPLTDRTAVLTSCGHFFCAPPASSCTRLSLGGPSGTCEQCGKRCDGGKLANKAAGYDDRVKSFVFDDVNVLAQTLCDILKFRETHRVILRENTESTLTLLTSTKAECNKWRDCANEALAERDLLREKINSLQHENDQLRRENDKAKLAIKNLQEGDIALRDRPAANNCLRDPPGDSKRMSNRMRDAPGVRNALHSPPGASNDPYDGTGRPREPRQPADKSSSSTGTYAKPANMQRNRAPLQQQVIRRHEDITRMNGSVSLAAPRNRAIMNQPARLHDNATRQKSIEAPPAHRRFVARDGTGLSHYSAMREWRTANRLKPPSARNVNGGGALLRRATLVARHAPLAHASRNGNERAAFHPRQRPSFATPSSHPRRVDGFPTVARSSLQKRGFTTPQHGSYKFPSSHLRR